jgi:spore coat protein A, manganese oxidase
MQIPMVFSNADQFTEELTIPSTIDLTAPGTSATLRMEEVRNHRFHSRLPAVKVWGFNGESPGPTIVAHSGTQTKVTWENKLLVTHPFPMPESAVRNVGEMPGPHGGFTVGHAVVHLHGARVAWTSDGYPDHHHHGAETMKTVLGPNESDVYTYPNQQPGAMLWYHDHTMGLTARNVYAGLAGAYLLRHPDEESIGLPSGAYELPLLIQDRSFTADGQLLYDNIVDPTMMEFKGTAIAVNGKLWPFVNVEPRRYRLRLVNGSNSRVYLLNCKSSGANPSPRMVQIGSDGGFIQHDDVATYLRTGLSDTEQSLCLAPGERADMLIDFSGSSGNLITMTNRATQNSVTGNGGDRPSYGTTDAVMQFRVIKPLTGAADVSLNTMLEKLRVVDMPAPLNEPANRWRQFSIQEQSPGVVTVNGKLWDDPKTEIIPEGTIELWDFANFSPDVHPMHLHLVQFQVIGRWRATRSPSGHVVRVGAMRAADRNERGWKDTVRSPKGFVTRIKMRFDGVENKGGHYVWHCHILEHEDMGMMRPLEIV